MEKTDNNKELSLFELICMCFTMICYFTCAVISRENHMPAVCIIMTGLFVVCGARVLYLAAGYYQNWYQLRRRKAKDGNP